METPLEPADTQPQSTGIRSWWIAGSIIILLGIVGGIWYVATDADTNDATSNKSRPGGVIDIALDGEVSQTCSLPTVDVPELAVTYGVPKDWVHQNEDDVITIGETDDYLTAAFIYTARLKKDKTPAEFLSQFADVFRQIIEAEGRTFTITEPSGTATVATADATASIEEGTVKGPFEVRKNKDFVTFLAYWAPEEEFATKESQLKQVTECFARTTELTDTILAKASAANNASDTSTELNSSTDSADSGQVESGQVDEGAVETLSNNVRPEASGGNYSGQYFSASVPAGWSVNAETDSGIDIFKDDLNASANYAYVTGAQGPNSAEAWARKALEEFNNISLSNLSHSQSLNASYSTDFLSGSKEVYDFSGTLADGRAGQGKIFVELYNTQDFGFGGYTSAFWGIAISTPELWPSVEGTATNIVSSVKILDIGQARKQAQAATNSITSQTSQTLSETSDIINSGYEYRNAIQDKSAGAWDSAMRGYDTFQSPSTGDNYDVPLNAYNPTGPDGAGYYRSLPGGGAEKLTPVD